MSSIVTYVPRPQPTLGNDQLYLQQELAAISGAGKTLTNQVNTNTTDIASLKASRTTDEANISSLLSSRTTDEATLSTHTSQISTINSQFQGYLFGLTLSTAGASTTFTVAAGKATDSTTAQVMALAASLSKTTAAWAVGAAAGSLDTGAIAANTWYHVFLIERTDLTVVDVLISLSATAPTLPANYTYFRRIGSMKTNGSSQWTSFLQLGDEFLWVSAPVVNASAVACSTTSALVTCTVPTGIQVQARLLGELLGSASAAVALLIHSPDQGTLTCTSGSLNLWAGVSAGAGADLNIRTNTSGQVRVVASAAQGTYFVSTIGWIDTRGKLY